jgi:hypothetical protein
VRSVRLWPRGRGLRCLASKDRAEGHRSQGRGEQREPPATRGGVDDEVQQVSTDERANDDGDDVGRRPDPLPLTNLPAIHPAMTP